jgi:DNA-binding response OmpR family regulator
MTNTVPFRPSDRINLANADVLLMDGHKAGLDILMALMAGYGVHTPKTASSAAEGMAMVQDHEFNLFIVDSALSDMDGYQFVQWLRRSGLAPNCFAPVLLLTGHTKRSEVVKGRDCGANFVLRKPVTPLVMLQRILWTAKENRAFVDSPNYCGPDRRFCALGPPVGEKGRRQDDLSADVGKATEPNLDQGDIDALFSVKKAG